MIAYVTQASEAAFLVPRDESLEEVRLEVLRENSEHCDANLYVAFNEADSNKISAICSGPLSRGEVTVTNVRVEFEVKHSYFDSLVKAVNRIPKVIINRILPTVESFHPLHDIPYSFIKSLLPKVPVDHDNQQKALHAILAFARGSPPLLINGSFGTGKTQVLAAATYCLIQYGIQHSKPVRVLICAHHQASPDHFIEKYFGSMFKRERDVLLVRLTANLNRYRYSKFSEYYMTSSDLTDHLCYHGIPSFLVIVSTFLSAPLLLRQNFEKNFFTHILMDEGAQTREPEAIAPLCLANVDTKIVIAGDSQQVSCVLIILCLVFIVYYNRLDHHYLCWERTLVRMV